MIRTLGSLLVSFCFFVSLSYGEQKQFTGLAYDIKSGKLLYLEQHVITYVNGQPFEEVIHYLTPDGEKLGSKEMSYVEPFAPDYTLTFNHVAREERVFRDDRRIVIDARVQNEVRIPDNNFAIDGGFHYFILKNFDQLLSGERISFSFLSASRGDFVPLRLVPTKNDSKKLTVEIRFDHFLLSRFIDPIVLTYSIQDQRLLSYEGLTNVPENDSQLFIARIEYIYDTDIQTFLTSKP